MELMNVKKIEIEIEIEKTLYPRNMVCFRCIIVNTPHNGDDKEC